MEVPAFTHDPARLAKKEIRTLARDIVSGKVFTNWHLEGTGVTDIRSIFQNFMRMPRAEFDSFVARGMSCVYEYMDQAQPGVTVKGQPTFKTARVLFKKDTERLTAEVERIINLEDEGL